MDHIGQKIKELRKKADLTQDRLAEMLGVSAQAVSKWEVGSASPDLSLIAPLCRVFGVTADELLGIEVFLGIADDLVEHVTVVGSGCGIRSSLPCELEITCRDRLAVGPCDTVAKGVGVRDGTVLVGDALLESHRQRDDLEGRAGLVGV